MHLFNSKSVGIEGVSRAGISDTCLRINSYLVLIRLDGHTLSLSKIMDSRFLGEKK